MLLTIYLAIVFCGAASLFLLTAVAFVQDTRMFSSAPPEAKPLLIPRDKELFKGARALGWSMMALSLVMILGIGVIAIHDGFTNNYTFMQFFTRFVIIFTIYKLFDMTVFDWFLLCKWHFFQYFYPEIEEAFANRKYGFNIKSQLLKLFVIFPAASAIAAWICTRFS
ncbi:MAG: hypothetical protein IJM63_13155 [Solobacterium sp.]|nr:hypothetical protein [Solobacterium sp.]